MSILLHIDSSPLYGRSVSRELTAAFVTQWKVSHPDGRVVDRDLNSTAMPPINAEWVGAVYTPEEARNSAAEAIAFALRLAARRIGAGR
jgi:FMN-dependent NADH-azoreductase